MMEMLLSLIILKVFPARLFGNKEKTGARIEDFLLRELEMESKALGCFGRSCKKFKNGLIIIFWLLRAL